MALRGDTVIFHAAMASGCGEWLTVFCFITGEDNVILHSTNVAYYWPLVQVSSWGCTCITSCVVDTGCPAAQVLNVYRTLVPITVFLHLPLIQ